MAMCNFCNQEFDNTQAVRAHLKWCPPYRGEEEPEGMHKAGMPRHAQLKGDDPVTRARQEYEKEKVDFKLDRIKEERRTWKDRQQEKDQAMQRQEREAQEARAREELDRDLAIEQTRLDKEEKSRREEERRKIEKIRRDRIQQVKAQAVDQYYSWPRVSSEFKVGAKRMIEKELGDLQIEDLPDSELKEIAEAVREKVYKPFFEKLAREDQQRQAERELVRRKSNLLNQGEKYVKIWVKKALEEEGIADLDPMGRLLLEWKVAQAVREALEKELQGDEEAHEIRDIAIDLAEDILDACLDEMGYE